MHAIDFVSGLARNFKLLAKSVFYTGLSLMYRLPGRRFDLFGRWLALRHKVNCNNMIQLLLNPVSSVRYFELDFANRNLPQQPNLQILDVSSPSLFGFFISERQACDYRYTNLDEREFPQISRLLSQVRVKGSYVMERLNATVLPYKDASFDVVVSISVIEHIPDHDDGKALGEMWRVLRPDGVLILTVPVSAQYEEEFRTKDIYGAGLEEVDGQFFFQRFYDEKELGARLINTLKGATQKSYEVYGERNNGFFREYEQRWLKRGLAETVKDPYLMARHMKSYDSIRSLPGIGVVGFCAVKRDGVN